MLGLLADGEPGATRGALHVTSVNILHADPGQTLHRLQQACGRGAAGGHSVPKWQESVNLGGKHAILGEGQARRTPEHRLDEPRGAGRLRFG